MKKQLCSSIASLFLPMASYAGLSAAGYYQRSHSRPALVGLALPGLGLSLDSTPDKFGVTDTNLLNIVQGSKARELLIIDEAVPDKSVFYKAVKPGIAVAEIRSGSDGLEQLKAILAEHQQLNAVHIVSHAEDGVVLLGNSRITAESVRDSVELFNLINTSIKSGGDLFFYGCNLAATEKGEGLLEILAGNTHVDLAASNDVTGNEEQGGNWALEIKVGNIEAEFAFSEKALQDFSAVLAPELYEPSLFCTADCSYSSPLLTSSDEHIVLTGSDGVYAYANFRAAGFYLAIGAGEPGHLQFAADGTNIVSFELTAMNFATDSGNYCDSANVTGYLAGGGTVSNTFTLFGSGSIGLPQFAGQQITHFRVNASSCTNIYRALGVVDFTVDNKQTPGDSVPPVFQNSTPSISNINTSGATLTARLDEVGTAFYVVVADGAAAPSSAQVVTGQNNSGVAALASGSINVLSAGVDYTGAISGLAAGTAYDVYVVARDAALNVQAAPVLVNVLTAASLADSPTLIFTANSADITADDVASDGEGGSIVITDIDIDIFNISDTTGTPTGFLSWQDNDILSSGDAGYSALTYDDGANGSTSGMAIQSTDGSEFQLEQFLYYNWGETQSATISVVGYRDGGQVASTTFEGYYADLRIQTILLDGSFANVDDIRIFISAGGVQGDLTSFHSINNIQVSPADPNASPTFANLANDSVTWAGVGNTVSLDSGADADLGDTDLEALNGANGDWSGASLTVQRNGTAVPEDIFGFDTTGASFEVDGSNLQSGGQTFATFTNTNGVLTITFTGSGTFATTALVNNIAQRITYRNDTPAGDATIRFTLSDGTVSTTADVTVTSDTIYVSSTSDVSTVDASDGVGLREAIQIADGDATGTQTLIFTSGLAGQTITLGSTLTIFENLTINADAASGLIIAGSSIDMNAGTLVSFINGSSDTATINSTLIDSGGLAKSGAGTLTLGSTSNSTGWSGAMSVTGGTLTAAAGTNPASTLSSGTLTLDGGTLSMTVIGTPGTTTTVANAVVLGAGGGTVEVGGGGGANIANFSGVISGGNLTKTAAAIMQLSGTNTYSGTTTVSAGTLSVASDSNIGTGSVSLGSGAVLALTGATTIDNAIALSGSATVSTSANATLSGVISGANTLIKSGFSTLTLSGTNTYAGTTISAGTVSIASDSNLGSGTVTLGNGTTLTVTGTGTIDNAIALAGNATVNNTTAITLSGTISGANTLTKTSSSTLTLSGTNSYAGTTISAGTVSVASDSNLGSGTVTMATGATLEVTGTGTIDNAFTLNGIAAIATSANTTLSGTISGANTLYKFGTSTLTLSGTNSYAGTYVLEGTLIVASDSNLGSGTITLDSGTTLEVTGATTIDNAISLGGHATVSNSDVVTLSGAISGINNLTKAGASTLTLSGTNTYGATTVSAGTLSVGSDSNLGSGTVTLGSGTTLAVTGATTIDNAIALSGNATISNSVAVTLSGAISGANTLTKAGASTLTLAGTNTYADTTVSAGTLSIASDTNLGSGTVTLASGTTLTITGSGVTIDNAIALSGNASISNANAVTLSGTISGNNDLTKSGAGTLTLSGNNTFTGTTTLSAGALSIASDASLGSGALTLASGSSLLLTGVTNVDNNIVLTGNVTFTISANTTLSGDISGGFSIAKNGAATLTLSGNNTYTGSTTVSGGTLSITGDSNLGGSAVALGTGTTLAITGSGTIDNNLMLAGAATVQADLAVTWSGVISGGTTLTKTGAGTLTLSGTNTHSGATTASAGTLLIRGSTDSATTVASGATLAGDGTIDGAVTIQNGGTLSPGSSPGTLTINGDLTMDSGSTLVVEINGTTAGTDYDQIIVNGAVDVTGATLSATHSYAPGNGDAYTIIDNDAADAITGTFSGVAEGASFTAGGNSTVLTTSYIDGSGNDITLTAPINVAPVVGDLNGDVIDFTEGGTPSLLDLNSDATVTDADSTDFDGGNVTVTIVSNRVDDEDILSIQNQGTGGGQIGVAGASVTYEGTTIGAFVGGSDVDSLVITLTADATPTAVQALVRNLTYANTNTTEPDTTIRTIRVTINDGDGATSSNADILAGVTAVNDAPTLMATGGTPTYTEGGTAADLFSAVTVSTVESGQTITGITLTVADVVDGASEILQVDGIDISLTDATSGTTVTNAVDYAVGLVGSTATVTLTKGAGLSSADTQTLVDAMTYRNSSVSPNTTSRVVTLTSIRDNGGTADGGVEVGVLAVVATVAVTAVNNAPTDIALSNASINQSNTGVGVDVGSLSTTDVDDSSFTYSLVASDTAATGNCAADGNNASFQINGAIVETAGLLASTIYNVCVQSDDGETTFEKSFAITVVDDIAPLVASVSVPANATYVAGNTLSFTVNTSENVTVSTAGGTPRLALTIGATTRYATYASGTGTSALVFSYTVQTGDNDADGIAVTALETNSGTLKDAAGNDLTLTLNSVGSTATVLVDTTAPTLQSLSPTDEATGVLPSANLVVTLSEDIALGTGNIVIFDSNDTPAVAIDVTNHAGQLSISGGVLTINPTADLVEQMSYYVQIAGTAITDIPGNAYAGIANNTSWNFSVADITPPVVAVITPDGTPAADDASMDFLVVFDETANAITTDDFTLTSTGAAAGTIASVSAASGSSVTVTVNGITGTGTLRLDVLANTDIVDDADNGNNTNGYVAAFTGGTAHTVDRDAPAAPSAPDLAVGSDSGESSTDDITNDTTPTFTGTAEANATVTVSSSVDGSLGTATADGSGNWSFTPGTALTAGTHFVSATATDATGNISAASASLTLQLDTAAPTGHSTGFDSGFYNAGNVASASFTFAGAEVDADYSYSIASSGGGTAVTGSSTLATATDQVTGLNLAGLGDGTLTLSVTVTDTAGNAASAVTANAVKDIVLPTGHSVSFDDATLNAAEAGSTSFTFAGAEVGATYSYSITSSGGGTAVTGSGTFATATDAVTGVNVSGLGDGSLTLSVVVTDTSGNASSAVTANASLDQAIPSVTLGSAAAVTVNGAFDATIAFSEAVSNFVVGDITAGNASLSSFTDNGGGSFSVTVTPTADGAVTLDVAASVAQDAAGNNNTAATQLSRTYDGTAPTLSSSNPADGATSVAGDANLVLTFSEAVVVGSGNLTLFDAADDSVVEAFAVGSASLVGNVLTLDPASNLVPTHSYYLQIANTALVDAAGNAYAGINDATTLNFTVANTAPVANADSESVAEDAAVSISVLTNDTDADSGFNMASVTVITPPVNGSTSVNTGTGVITYTPTANYNGSDSFTYTVEDVYSALSNVATVAITVTPVNDAPVAVADIASTPEDNAVSINVAANDTDLDTGDTLDTTAIVVVSAPANGTTSVVNGEVVYTPNTNFNGSDSFTYTIEDAAGALSNGATVLINVTGVNDLPTAGADTATVDEDGTVEIDVLTNDSDVDGSIDATSVSLLAAASNGSTSVDALTGAITYTPTAHFNGTDTFSYAVQDNSGGSATATVTVTVTSLNDAPVANADTATLQEDVAHTINVLGNDTDLDGTLVLASVQVVTAAGQGTTSVNAGTGAIVYTPADNFNGSDTFTYRVQDDEGAWSTPATVTITVQDVNDEPLANNDSTATNEDTAVTLDLLANDSDVDGTLNPAALVLLTQPANGSLTDNGDGTITYTPTANVFGSDSFTYTVADNDGGVSNTATVTLTVNPVNDAPVISGTPAVTVAEDSAYSFVPTASDVDNTTLTFSVTNLPVWASFNASTGALTGTPENDHVGNHSGIVISVSDGLLSASLPVFAISVSNVNDPPVITGTPPASINQGGSYNFTPTVVDVDAGTTLTYSIANQPSWASFDPATGAFTGTPTNSDVGSYNNIVISVSDGVTTTPLTSFNVTVANVNDAPVIAADSYSLNEGGLLNPNAANGVLANDVDIDGDTLTATLVVAPRNASEFTLNGDGSFNYLHSGDETRQDSFTYLISDGTLTTNPITVSLAIAAVNDAPTFVTEPDIALLEGTAYSYDVGVTDPDSVISLSLVDGPDWLTLTGNRLSGTAPLNEIGAVSVVLRAADGQYTVDQTYNLTVAEQEASLVTITTTWQGLPSIVDSTVDLIVTLTHNKGPALSGATLNVALRDVDTASTMANCTAGTNAFTCPVNLAAGNSISFRLRLTPEEEGNLIVNLNLTQAAEQIAATITDVSVTERAVSQGDVTFNIANATALASINLLNDGTRELVAGTALGDTVKLLNYTISSGTAQVIGEIENRGYTDRIRVADIDQDGLEDIVVANRSGDASAVYYDRGDTFATEPGSVTLAHAREALVRDLNDDGFPELILGASGFNLYIYENNEGVYDIPPLVFNSPASIVHFALLRRLPADAPLEGTLVITSSTAVQLVRFGLNPDGGAAKPEEGEGLGGEGVSEKFSLVRELPLAGVSSIQLVDIDGDGREEVVASTTHQSNSSEASGLTVIAVTPDDQLQEVARLGAASAKHVEVADFNGDGLPDLLVANDNNSYQFYRGTGEVANWTLTNTILYHSSTLVIPEDVNGDGLADVLVYEDGDEQVELYLSAPDGETGETADLVASASVTPLQPNNYQFEYTLNLANQGAFVAENVRVNLPLPDGVGVVGLPENCLHDEEVDEVNCTLPNLDAAGEQAIVLILEGDSRINNLSLTAHATSDALEVETTNNSATTSLSGMFQYKRARIKGGGGCFDYLWLAGLLGLGLRRRRKTSKASDPAPILVTSPGRKVASLLLPLSAALVLAQPNQQAHAETPTAKNSYIEATFGSVTSDWDTLNFFYDLGDTTQEGALIQKDDQRLGWQLLYGFRAHRNLALEVGYIDSGETELEVDAIVSDTGSLRQLLIDNAPISGDGPYLGLRASYFAEGEQELYLKAGIWSWSAGYDLMIGDQHEWVTSSGTDWLLGLGFAVPVNQRFKVGGSLQSTSLGDERLMLVGINLVYQFDVRF